MRKLDDLRLLPRFEDGLTFLYVEHVRVEQENHAIVLVDKTGRTAVPVASLATLLLGPGCAITHAAMVACADCGCSVVFVGEGAVRCYASGLGETRNARNLLDQATHWADPRLHLGVVRTMYRMRFTDPPHEALTLDQIRGMEGARVRETYARMAKETGIVWTGRRYDTEWTSATPVNRSLSTANACLYGLCHAAIVSLGFSPGLGFVHTGKSLAFVYDIADLYKCDTTIPVAFRIAKAAPLRELETATRKACRDAFRKTRLLECIAGDLQRLFGGVAAPVRLVDLGDEQPAEPYPALWDLEGPVEGGRNYEEESEAP
jgi:CRISPR-associated protein Cas1